MLEFVKSFKHIYFFAFVLVLLAAFRTYIDCYDVDCSASPANLTLANQNFTIIETNSDLPLLDKASENSKSISSSKDDDFEKIYDELEKSFIELESDFVEKEEEKLETVDTAKQSEMKAQTIVEKEDLNVSGPTKIITTIKLNAYITVTSTIISNKLFLDKNSKEKSKIAEAIFDISIPEHDIDVSINTDIVFDPENHQGIICAEKNESPETTEKANTKE